MGTSVRPDPVADYLQARGNDPVADYLAAKGSPAAKPTAPTAKGASGSWGDEPGPGLAAHFLNAMQGIPGVERLEAGAGAIGNGISYGQSLKALREITGGISPAASTAERMAASLLLLRKLPANPMLGGALLGGADQALSADEMGVGERAGRTAAGTAIGGTLGKVLDVGVTAGRSLLAKTPAANLLARAGARAAAAKLNYGKALAEGVGKPATPQVQQFLAQPDVAEIVTELQSTRPFAGVPADDPKMLDAIYKTLSDRGAVVKKGLESVSPNKPNIGRFRGADIAATQQRLLDVMSTPGSVTTPETSQTITRIIPPMETAQSPAPDIRDAVRDFWARPGIALARKEGTIQQRTAREALERHSSENIAAPPLRGEPGPREITETILTPASTIHYPAMMPSYRGAVADYAEQTAGMDALKQGVKVLKNAKGGAPSVNSLLKSTPEAFQKWLQTATPAERKAAAEGILGELKASDKMTFGKILGTPLVPIPSKAARVAPGLLRMAEPNGSLFAKLSLLGMNSP